MAPMTGWWWISVLVATICAFVVGGVWYSPGVFGKRWMALNRFSDGDLAKRPMRRVFAWSFVLALVMTLNLAFFLGASPSIAFATSAGAAAGLGWAAAGLGIVYLFERRPLGLWLINGGYLAVTLTVIGLVLGVFARFG